jgi:hypothetical protein
MLFKIVVRKIRLLFVLSVLSVESSLPRWGVLKGVIGIFALLLTQSSVSVK